jgi:two-component system invasion response regulator UvrY
MTRVRVVVVDDQPAFRRAAATVIQGTDQFELVGEADSGESAIELLDRCVPDLVLLDVKMPGMGGVVAAELISALHPQVRIVLISTYDRGSLPAAARQPGLGYLHKEALSADRLRRIWSDADDR